MVIKKEGSQYCVFSKSGEKIACHDTRGEALAQLRAIEASDNEEMSEARSAWAQVMLDSIIVPEDDK